MNREVIINALFALVSQSANFATASRRLQLWSGLSPSEKPALFLCERSDTYAHSGEATPATVTMELDLYIYTDAKDPTIIPASILNPLIDAVENALALDPLSGLQTLGGLVSHCWIDGKVMKDAGDLDGDGVAIIPVKILVAA